MAGSRVEAQAAPRTGRCAMNRLAFVLVFAALSAYAQPPALPAGTHSADAPQTTTLVPPNSLDAAEDAMVKHDLNAALTLLQKHLGTNPPSPQAARAQYAIAFS